MEKYEPIWDGVLKFLGVGSIASVGNTCRMLYPIARDELKLRAMRYLESANPWEHGYYPVQGYYGVEKYDDGDGKGKESGSGKRSLWVRCDCEHHERLFLGQNCSCESHGKMA